MIKKIIGITYYIFLSFFFGRYNASLKIYINFQKNRKSFFSNCYINNTNLGSAKLIRERINFLDKNIEREKYSSGVENDYVNNFNKKVFSIDYNSGKFFQKFGPDNTDIKKQQRGLSIIHVEKLIEKKSLLNIAEFGCGNGDVLSHLAKKYLNINFFGIDFYIHNCLKKYSNIKNLKFIKGYINDILINKPNFDLVFCSSTLTCFLPQEINNFFKNLNNSKTQFIILNEPHWGPLKQENNYKKFSYHVENNIFFHNYAGYLRENNFQVIYYESKLYKDAYKKKPNLHNNLIVAVNKSY
tara:strand:+ start:616 stop:1509 length:894 start_codon:yes stop_codon:yes gene_type:complete